MTIYLIDKQADTRTELFGIRAFFAGAAIIILPPIVVAMGFLAMFVGPFLSGIAILGGIGSMFIVGINFWNVVIVGSGTMFAFVVFLFILHESLDLPQKPYKPIRFNLESYGL
jgi:hypothetical protein